MGELEDLKKQNKRLKALLKNAVQLLNRYKAVLQQAGSAQPKGKRAAKKTGARKVRKPSSSD